MRLLITRRLPDRVLEAARARFDVVMRDETTVLSPEELRAALRDFDLVLPTLGDRFQPEVFADVPQPRAKVLANFGVGYNHIDVAAAKAAGISVSNTPGTVTDATADIALSLILMTARRLGEGERILRAGAWSGWGPVQMLGTHVTGKTVGIIGLGRIGKAIARRCHFGFGMEVIFHNRSIVADPGMPARQVPNETALIRALQTGQIAGAGLDVYEFEPKVPVALMAMENVTLLPHLGTACLEVREAMGMMALDNLIAFAEGREMPNLLNR